MQHVFIAPEQIEKDRIFLTGPDVNHLKNALRMAPGEQLSVSAGETLYQCQLVGFPEDRAELQILAEKAPDTELKTEITLFQGLPKGDKLETVIQKAVELGAFRVVPVAMARSIVKVDPKKAAGKLTRLQAISESAAKQSKRNRIPEVGPFMTFKEALEFCKKEEINRILVPYENERGMEGARALVDSIRPTDRVGIFIGPEGGFALEEIRTLKEKGGETISLGHRILRTETAGMAMLSVLAFQLEED